MPFVVKKLKAINTSSLQTLGDSVVDLSKYVEDEFGSVARSLQATEPRPIWNRAPPKPRRGTTAYADGTNWNPGQGEGPYWFDGTAWHSEGAGLAGMMANYLGGLIVSNSGGTTFTVSAGSATDSLNKDIMALRSPMTKTMASWAAGSGNGGLDTGTIAANVWYYPFLIKNPSTGAVDVLFSLSATAPTLPSGYTLFRRIGALASTTGPVWQTLIQYGDQFIWPTYQPDANGWTPASGTAVGPLTVSVPPAIPVEVYFVLLFMNPVAGHYCAPYSTVASYYGWGLTYSVVASAAWQTMNYRIRTVNGQLIFNFDAASNTVYVWTKGWYEERGKNGQ